MSESWENSINRVRLNERFVKKITDRYLTAVRNLAALFGIDGPKVIEIVKGLLLELYFRMNYKGLEERQIDEQLILLLAFKIMEADGRKLPDSGEIAALVDLERAESEKWLTRKWWKKKQSIDDALNTIGEPGRTLLKLSFFDFTDDEAITGHLHFGSEDEMRKKRVRALERFSKLTKNQ